MRSQSLAEDLLAILPLWYYKIHKPFKQSLVDKMSLESYYCLQTLRRYGAMTMTQLSRRLKITKQQATKIIERLFEHDFVTRCNDPVDRRHILIDITDKARAYIDTIYHRDSDFLQRLEAKISAEELEELDKAVQTLLRILPKLD